MRVEKPALDLSTRAAVWDSVNSLLPVAAREAIAQARYAPKLVGDEGWLSFEQAAERAGVSIGKFRKVVKAGEIPTVLDRKTRRRKVYRFAVDAWVDAHRVQPGSLAHLDANLSKYRKGRAR